MGFGVAVAVAAAGAAAGAAVVTTGCWLATGAVVLCGEFDVHPARKTVAMSRQVTIPVISM